MQPCKKIEIVVEERLAAQVASKLVQIGAPGYTMIPRASGRGVRGERRADDPVGTLTNCVFLIACDADVAALVVEGVRSTLQRAGGICVVSDATWLHY